jgi:hypothetical protein
MVGREQSHRKKRAVPLGGARPPAGESAGGCIGFEPLGITVLREPFSGPPGTRTAALLGICRTHCLPGASSMSSSFAIPSQMAKLTVRSKVGPRPRAHLCHAGSERAALPVQPLAAVGYADPRGGIKTPIGEQDDDDRRARGADRAAPDDAFERPVDRSHAELDDVSPEASWHLRVASQNHRRAVASERVAV